MKDPRCPWGVEWGWRAGCETFQKRLGIKRGYDPLGLNNPPRSAHRGSGVGVLEGPLVHGQDW